MSSTRGDWNYTAMRGIAARRWNYAAMRHMRWAGAVQGQGADAHEPCGCWGCS